MKIRQSSSARLPRYGLKYVGSSDYEMKLFVGSTPKRKSCPGQ